MDAAYQYYLHGPLARVELGQHKVQGIDYAYTIQGWLKGVNGTVQSADMGNDGYGGSNTGRDALGLALHYNDSDYKSIQTLKHPFAVFSTTGLFNGNISAMTVSNHALGNALAYAYQYDQLNRLITKTSWRGLDTAVNRWTPVALPDYKESLRYDANGNILTNNRYGNAQKGQMDQLTYYYKTGTNQLRHVKDAIAAAGYSTDIDDQQPDNYSYDAIGNLIADKSERIDTISWTVYGKIAGIKKRNGTIRYKYDAAGNRVYKQSVLDGKTNTSFYVRDAQGNVLGVYDLNEKGLSWEEQHLYGSSRLGVYRYGATVPLQPVTTKSASAVLQDSMAWGSRVYELSNHLGNVLATVSDKKLQVAGTGNTVAYYRAEILSANDYFAFGSLIEDRSFAVGNGYRYGFNGKENDNEVKGNGNQQDYGLRIYDPRLARFLSIDPLEKEYPWYTPYQFAGNTPIQAIDLDGGEPKYVGKTESEKGKDQTYIATGPGGYAKIDRNWLWHAGGLTTTKGQSTKAGWYSPDGYVDMLSKTRAAYAAAYNLNIYSPAARTSKALSAEAGQDELTRFIGDGSNVNAAKNLITAARQESNRANANVSGRIDASGFNVEDVIGITVLLKQLVKQGSKLAVSEAAKGVSAPKGWITQASKKGGGTVFKDPSNPHNIIRQMPGNPNSPNLLQQNPYVKFMKDGNFYDVSGKILPNGNVPGAHIPLNQFNINNMPKF